MKCPKCDCKDTRICRVMPHGGVSGKEGETNYSSWAENMACNFCAHTWRVVTRWFYGNKKVRREINVEG